ncbi:hypothetical protein C8P63_11241 [Melghirimyces profundicolus]|uniref:Uncharacterized protein n=1 Tax=Melghirimyces profundicolus TaxID=1242148 RepID=A0A2T6BTI6_9BACL|nr:hypothetical protein [Melghirimyces profundicolus]PTX59346.1 hypothetical protein C8P63_11241 [Melghirimyces profundicolus]
MFLHGIPYVHLVKQFPVLEADGKKDRKSASQKSDARHLVRQMGFEPIHLLRTGPGYALVECVRECLRYGDTVLAFSGLPYPRIQLSRHEWGVPRLEMGCASWILTTRDSAAGWLKRHLPRVPVLMWEEAGREGSRRDVGGSGRKRDRLSGDPDRSGPCWIS